MNESSGTLLAGLVWLRLAGIVVLAISAALGIATTVFVDTQLATYSRTLDGCTAAQDLLVTSAGATRELRFLLQCARQWLNCSAAMVAARQATISVAADAFSTEHRGLYDTAYQVGYQDSYEAPVVPVNWYGVEVDSAVEGYEGRTMSLYEAGPLPAAAPQAGGGGAPGGPGWARGGGVNCWGFRGVGGGGGPPGRAAGGCGGWWGFPPPGGRAWGTRPSTTS